MNATRGGGLYLRGRISVTKATHWAASARGLTN